MRSPSARSNVRWVDPTGPVPAARVPVPQRDSRGALHDAVWDFPPGSPGAARVKPPPAFLRRLRQVDPKATLAFQPVMRRWIVWRRGRKGDWVCVCPVQDPTTRKEWPLDNRILGIMYASDPASYGGARAMWLQVKRQMEAAEDAKRAEALEVIREVKTATDRHAKIRVGYGKSPGNKFATWVSGEKKNPDFKL